MEDENLKKASQAAELAAMQDKARDYQRKLAEFQSKIFTGKVGGVNMKMSGDFKINEIKIDQSFYEMASKDQLEVSILRCYNNLYTAVSNEINDLNGQFQQEMKLMSKDAGGLL